MNLDLNFSGVTLLKDWWKKVKSNFSAISTAHESHRTAATLDHPDKSVQQKHIADKAVGTTQIADYCIGPGQISQYAISSAKIYPAAVQSSHIRDANVTEDKLAESCVTEGKIADGSVTEDKLAESCVTEDKIAEKCVTEDKLASNCVTRSKLAENTVDYFNLSDDALSFTLNSYDEADTYKKTQNSMVRPYGYALFKSFSSNYGTIANCPSDTTPIDGDEISYVLLEVQMSGDRFLQIAMNTSSFRRFARVVFDGIGYKSEWTEL